MATLASDISQPILAHGISYSNLSCSLGPAWGGVHTVAEKVFRVRAAFWHPNVAVNMMLSAPTLLGTGVNVRSVAVRYPMGQDWLGDVRSQCQSETLSHITRGMHHLLHHIWQNLLQTEENLLDFVRFMGVMSSCNNPAVNYWFHKTIGNFKPYYPWNAPPNENPYHARRGIKEHVIQNAFRKAQLQGLSMLATGGEPRGDATSETSSDEDTGRQGSDVELESSDDELPYIDPNMEPVQQRPVMFVSRVPAKKPRKLPWPTPKTHPVKRTNVKTSDRSDKAEAQSTPERPGPSEQSSVTVEPAHPTPVEMPMVILHQPPPVPKPVPVKPTPPPSRRRRGPVGEGERVLCTTMMS